ncbi:hypothetical protein [Pseudonocardia phyllosphaerae]|uniref:hypothetical protein n=1 Tax=Pseudonocardia phyllosphaerae TaxID=3390502 RepID=UPI003978074B
MSVDVSASDRLAEPRPCGRCSNTALLRLAEFCPDCIAQIGTNPDRTEYDAWRAENHRRVVEGEA